MAGADRKSNEPSSRRPRRPSSSQQSKVLRWHDENDSDVEEEHNDDDIIDLTLPQQPRSSNNHQKQAAKGKSRKTGNNALMVVPLTTAKRKKIQRPSSLTLPTPFASNAKLSSTRFSITSSSKASPASIFHDHQQQQHQQSMWVDKYAPIDSKSLCVAPKKVKEIRHWLEQSIATNDSKLLILVGSPGIGKSTMIRVLAKELKLQIHEWTDVVSSSSRNYDYGDACIESLPLLQSLEEFLQKAGAGFQSLHMKTTTSTVSSASAALQRAASATVDKRGKKRKTPGLTPQDNDDIVNNNINTGSIILLDELPNLPNAEMEARFRDIMTQHLLTTQVPTVLIYSLVREGKHKPDDLERLVEPNMLYSSSMVQIAQIHAVTKPKLKHVLENIARQERLLSASQLKHFNWDEVHLQCQGDVRHAIMSLQFEHAADGSARGTAKDNNKDATQQQQQRSERDVSLSTFHALGKLLYAKKRRIPIANAPGTVRQVLDFDPDAVMEHAGMGLSGSLTFLEYHSPEFFTDMTELSDTLALYSDAVTLLDSTFQSDRTIFPNAHVGSIAGRAVAYCNDHPAPNKFRQFSSPKVFDVLKRRKQNLNSMDRLCQQLSQQQLISVGEVVTAGSTFVKDHIPYLRFILPDEINSTLGNLHSHVSAATARRTNYLQSDDTEHLQMEIYAQEQQDILDVDDILDSDDDNNDRKRSARAAPMQTPSLIAAAPPQVQASEAFKEDASISPTSAIDDLGHDIIIIDD